MFKKEIGEIYRLTVPFEEVYTSVFLIKRESNYILVDCATSKWDVDTYVLPSLKEQGIPVKDIGFLVLTHTHCDHAGGKERIIELNPQIEIINTADSRIENCCIVPLKGHTIDSIGVLDLDSGTLIAGDGLQGYGIGKYGCTFEDREEYISTVIGLKNDDRIENVLFSHAFSPWNECYVFGRKGVKKCLDDCLNYIEEKIQK